MLAKLTSQSVAQITNILTNLFDKKIIFSDPIEREGVTIIPVSKIYYGVGGGVGNRGDGAGGGMIGKPLGYIEIKDGETTFKRIQDPMTNVHLIMMSGIAGYLLFRGVSRLFR